MNIEKNNQNTKAEDEKPAYTYYHRTGGTTFEIEVCFSGSQTYSDIVKNAIRRESESDPNP